MELSQGTQVSYAICINNEGHPLDLELLKVYAVLPPEEAERDLEVLRIIDESGEDYLYPSSWFMPVQLPQTGEQTVMDLMKHRSEQP